MSEVRSTVAPEVQVSVKQVLELLDAGKTRAEIKAELGISHKQSVLLFQHPKLKGKRTKTSATGLTIIDDTEEETVPAVNTPTAPATATEDAGHSLDAAAPSANNADWTTAPVGEATPEVVPAEVVDDRAPFERG